MIPMRTSTKTADNYFFENELSAEMFEGNDIAVFAGPMVTVLGTSLQNRDLLNFSTNRLGDYRTGNGGSYYQKRFNRHQKSEKCAARCQSKICITLIIHLKPGSTLASGGLGTTLKPTYLITIKILEQIFNVK
jgi:hypothetical protein